MLGCVTVCVFTFEKQSMPCSSGKGQSLCFRCSRIVLCCTWSADLSLGKEPQSEIPGNRLILMCHLRGVRCCIASFGMKEPLGSGREKYSLNVEVTAGKCNGFQGEGPTQGSKSPESVPTEEELFCFLSLFVFN